MPARVEDPFEPFEVRQEHRVTLACQCCKTTRSFSDRSTDEFCVRLGDPSWIVQTESHLAFVTCKRCGLRMDFTAPDLISFADTLSEFMKSHRCRSRA